MRQIAIAVALASFGTFAHAEGIQTEPPRTFAGFQYAYGYHLLALGNCQDQRGADGCRKEERTAINSLENWNRCLDEILASSGTKFLWPRDFRPDRYLAQLDYRAAMEEDLIVRLEMCEQMKATCLPATTTSVGPC